MNWDSSPCLAFQCTGSAAPEGGSWWWGWASVILVSKRLQHGIKMLDGGCTQRWHSSSWPWHLLQTWVGFDSHVFINMILNDSWTNIVSMCGGNYTPYIQDGRVAVTFKKLFAETTHLPGGHGLTTFIVLLVHLLKLGYQQLHMPWLVTRHWNHNVEADMVQHQVFFLRMAPFKMLRRVTKSSECFPHNRFPALSQVHGSCHSSATSSPWFFSSQTWSDKVYWQIKTNKSICAEFHITPIYIYIYIYIYFFFFPLTTERPPPSGQLPPPQLGHSDPLPCALWSWSGHQSPAGQVQVALEPWIGMAALGKWESILRLFIYKLYI